MARKIYKTAEFQVVDESKPRMAGQYWCPYEGEFHFFEIKENWSLPRCEGCNISLEDYYVKMANHLWGDAFGKKDKK